MTEGTHRRWYDVMLLAAIVAVTVYAGLLVVAGSVVGDEVFGRLGFGPESAGITDGQPAYDYTRFIFGVLGAVIIGWMVLMLFIVVGPLRRRERWAWNAVTASIAIWFTIDTTFSFAVGEWEHGLFNVVFLVLIAVPLVAMRGDLATPS